ncbi:MAG: ExeM/NucH family extracellular endonuclease, partial [Anaerolineales bacterium]
MKKTRWIHIIGALAMALMAWLAIWAFVLSATPTSATPAATCPTALFFSEYIEGSSNNKAIEIYNGTGEDVTMTDYYSIALFSNGNTFPGSTLDLTGVLAAGEVYVIADSQADADILDEADTTSGVALFNGNDALVLYKDGVVVDALGQVGNDAYWGAEVTLVRKPNVMQGDPVEDDAFDPAIEWDEYAQNTFDYLGSHTMDPCDTAFSISKSAPATVAPNEAFTYTLIVNNNTGVTPATTTITDVVPSGAAFIAASDGGAESGGVVSWDVSNFADGATLTRTFRVTATGTQEIQNIDYGVNGSDDWPTTTLGVPVTTQVLADLLIDKSAPATASEGDVFTYTLTITNELGFTLNDVLITDAVPSNVAVASVLDGGADVNGVISWTVASLAHQAEVDVRFVVTATDLSSPILNDDYAVSAANYTTPTFGAPVETSSGGLRIYHLQGEGDVSPYVGQTVTVEGIVTADFQASDELEGFFMQDPFGDNNPATSDGIFVYSTQAVDLGDRVEVTGIVAEYNELTEISSVSNITLISTGATIEPTEITLPEMVNDEMERYEGMLVTLPHTLTVQQNYFQGRYGQVTLGSGNRMYQPTHLHEPGSTAYWDQVDENARRLLVLDDGSSDQNPDPIPYIGISDTLRAGDIVSAGMIGVLDQGPINNSSTTDYRLHPTENVTIDRVNERPATPPDVGGSLQVASFNVLNYFTTFGERGADNQAEFDRQRTKIITALVALDADVVGLMEIENNGYDTVGAIYDLVDGLNEEAGAGAYAFIDPGVAQIGDDEIAVGLLYQSASVTPVGAAAILDDSFDSAYNENKNRPALAQTFEENTTGERFTAVVNHLKSKGSPCDSLGDPDMGDGQGNCNLTRTSAMSVEISWLATDPTNSGDPDFIIIGDLNAYVMEDPISVAKNAGYTDLLGAADYSYIFDGESGYLDYALTNDSLTAQVAGAEVWHINADEPSVIDYNTEYKSQDLYAPDAYRSSDHDPVLVGLNLLEQTVLTITKAVIPTTDVIVGDTVTYVITLENIG